MKETTRDPSLRRSKDFYKLFPKVELHRHLEGSLRINTMAEVARSHGLDILGTGQLRSMVQVHENDPFTFQNFLSKFETLRLFYRSPDIIGRITREAIEDAALDNVRYMELRFTPVALSVSQGFQLTEVVDWVIEHTQLASEEYGITTRLIVSVNRHESPRVAEEVVRLAVDRLHKGIVGVDLAGNESDFSQLPFVGLFREARQAGLHITVHAGEWGGAENVADALVLLGAERIGHGVRVMEDSTVVDLARERKAVFEVCVTSNYQSGVVPALSAHPLTRMLAAGLVVTVNTDDPSISRIELSDEYCLVCEDLSLSLDELQRCVMDAMQAAFLPEAECLRLMDSLKTELAQLL